jgi:hypothetical protein
VALFVGIVKFLHHFSKIDQSSINNQKTRPMVGANNNNEVDSQLQIRVVDEHK